MLSRPESRQNEGKSKSGKKPLENRGGVENKRIWPMRTSACDHSKDKWQSVERDPEILDCHSEVVAF